MNRLSTSVLTVLLTQILCAPEVLAAKPPGGGRGGADTTPPGTVADLTARGTVRSISLRFTATGDDGNTGTAARYDVRYLPVANLPPDNDCLTGDPSTWSVAARSQETPARPTGTTDYFDIRGAHGSAPLGLTADTAFCVALRVLDEVSNGSGWARLPALAPEVSTLAGDWTLTALPIGGTPSSAAKWALGVRVIREHDDPTTADFDESSLILAGWAAQDISGSPSTLGAGSLQFAALSSERGAEADELVPRCSPPAVIGDCVETVPSNLWNKYIDVTAGQTGFSATFTQVPGSDVAAFLVYGTKVGSRTKKNPSGTRGAIIVQRSANGGWTVVGENNDGVQPLNDPAFIPAVDGYSGSYPTLAYTPIAPNDFSSWHPVVVWVAQVANTSSYAESAFYLSERNGMTASGWSAPVALAIRQSGGSPYPASGLFSRRQVFNKPDGTLAVFVAGLGDVADPNSPSNRASSTYAERVAVSVSGGWNWQWRYYSVDPIGTSNFATGFDEISKLVLGHVRSYTSEIRLFREPQSVNWLVAPPGAVTPLPSYDYRNPSPFALLGSWELVYDDPVYDAEILPQLPAVGARALFSDCGQVQTAGFFRRWANTTSGYTQEHRAISANGYPGVDERVDSTHGSADAMLSMPDGDRALAYSWAYDLRLNYLTLPANYVYLARGSTGCTPAP